MEFLCAVASLLSSSLFILFAGHFFIYFIGIISYYILVVNILLICGFNCCFNVVLHFNVALIPK